MGAVERGDPEAAREYGRLKRALAEWFADGMDGYADGKTEFILAIMARAGFSDDHLADIRAINTEPAE